MKLFALWDLMREKMLFLDSISQYDAFSLYIVKFPNSNINAVILQHSIQYRMHCSKMVAIITYTRKFLQYRKCEKFESTSYFYQKMLQLLR